MRNSHGGPRKGAGQPAKEPTKTVRVKVALIEQIEALGEDPRGFVEKAIKATLEKEGLFTAE